MNYVDALFGELSTLTEEADALNEARKAKVTAAEKAAQLGMDFAAGLRNPPKPVRTRGKGGLDPKQIVKILSVVDTREYEEIADGVFKPIPGSGIESFCARCGAPHEVHATVQLADKNTAVVGTSCMKGSSLEKEARAGASAAKVIAKLEVHLKHLLERYKGYRSAWAKVMEMPFPNITHSGGERGQMWMHMGDVKQGYFDPKDEQHAANNLKHNWRRKQLAQFGYNWDDEQLHFQIRDTKKALDKKRAALERLLAQAKA